MHAHPLWAALKRHFPDFYRAPIGRETMSTSDPTPAETAARLAPKASIKPTVGAPCWFWCGTSLMISMQDTPFRIFDHQQPFHATIAYVSPDGLVTVAVHDHNGMLFSSLSTPLRDPLAGDKHGGEDAALATWTPTQVARAKSEADQAEFARNLQL